MIKRKGYRNHQEVDLPMKKKSKRTKKRKGKTIYKELQPLYVYLARLKARIQIKFCNNKNKQLHINCKSCS